MRVHGLSGHSINERSLVTDQDRLAEAFILDVLERRNSFRPSIASDTEDSDESVVVP
jgi:fructose-1,6-bisphosphatase/inositol monophosphatase family enzyme